MGTFCTTTSLQTLMPGTNFDSATTSLATECISQAEDKIREVLSARYDMSSAYFQTSTSIPPIVQTWAKWLSMGYMYEFLARGGKEAYVRSDRSIKRAMDNMEKVVSYKANILDSSGSMIPEGSNSYSMTATTSDYTETFGEDDPLNWKVDPDKLDDIADDRD